MSVSVQSAIRSGTQVTVKGTVTQGSVTVDLRDGGLVLASQLATPDQAGNWESNFDPAPPAAKSARGTMAGGKFDEADIA